MTKKYIQHGGTLLPLISIIEARRTLTRLPEQLVASDEKAAVVTRRGQPVMVVMDWEEWKKIEDQLK